MNVSGNTLICDRRLDDDTYTGVLRVIEGDVRFTTKPAAHSARFTVRGNAATFICVYGKTLPAHSAYGTFDSAAQAAAAFWQQFWTSGGAIDLSDSTDPRWKELERRVVLSQYLMRANNAGSLPPAEFALMHTDPWQGEFHMEMLWWHLAHYALWDRWDLAEKALSVYPRFLPIARKRAAQLGYRGAKWGKQMSADGMMCPWDGNLQLNWQQPHPIFFAELDYRLHGTEQTLQKWREIVFATADFMASFTVTDREGICHLEHVMTANENGACHDPTFESVYWRWGLDKAQEWRRRLGMQPELTWKKVRDSLAPLSTEMDPILKKQIYGWCGVWTDPAQAERPPGRQGHPDIIGPCAFLPFVEGLDTYIAANTVESVRTWQMGWGWDFPWYAMAAARTGQSELGMDVLLDQIPGNSYSDRGICGDWYFPGNGGLLYAVAMMAAGWDNCPKHHAPGFPDNGTWKVRWEGLKRAL